MTDINNNDELEEQKEIEKFKNKVEEVFENLMIEKVDKNRKINKFNNSSEQCIEKAYEELEFIREKFIQFQDDISDLVIGEYIMPAVEQFAIYAASMSQVISDDYIDDDTGLNDTDRKKLKDLRRFRAQILSSINNRYKL